MEPFEAYGAVAGEMFIPGEADYLTPDEVLMSLDPPVVEAAEKYAREHRLPWPPIASGVIAIVEIQSL